MNTCQHWVDWLGNHPKDDEEWHWMFRYSLEFWKQLRRTDFYEFFRVFDFHGVFFGFPPITWLFEALTCSRREDGLSCRHGFKPPLTHSPLNNVPTHVPTHRRSIHLSVWISFSLTAPVGLALTLIPHIVVFSLKTSLWPFLGLLLSLIL